VPSSSPSRARTVARADERVPPYPCPERVDAEHRDERHNSEPPSSRAGAGAGAGPARPCITEPYARSIPVPPQVQRPVQRQEQPRVPLAPSAAAPEACDGVLDRGPPRAPQRPASPLT
jgi:hypothetical protein